MLVLGLIAVRVAGERYWITSLALFPPAQFWLLPLFILFPLALLWRRRLLWLLLIPVPFVFFIYLPFRISSPDQAGSGNTLSILSNNIGQRKTRTMWEFLHSENPDVFVLQDSWNHKKAISSENPTYYVSSQGEFLLASRYEIKNSGFVPDLRYRQPIAAWFEIDFHGTPVIIYNVHMPTPRQDVMRLGGRGLLSGARRGAYKDSLEKRNQLALDLLEVLKNEKRRFVVAGDFNMPETGFLRRCYADHLTDCFAEKGKGYGFTFPGSTWNPLTLFGPWLRIDYIFASKDWKPLSFRVEPRQPAQHLSISARLELLPGEPRSTGR